MSRPHTPDQEMPSSIAVDYLVYRYDPPRRGGGRSGFAPAESNLQPAEREWWHESYRHWWEPRGTDIRWGPSVCYLIARDLAGRNRAILCYRKAGTSVARRDTVSFLLIASPAELTAGVALALADWSWAAGTFFDPAIKPNLHWYMESVARQRARVPSKTTPYVVPAAGDGRYENILMRIIVDLLEKSNENYSHHLLVPGVEPNDAARLLENALGALDNDCCQALARRFSFSTSQKDNIPAATAPRVVFATQKFTWQGRDVTILDGRESLPDQIFLTTASILVRVSRRTDRHIFDEVVSEPFNQDDPRGWCERLTENSGLRGWLSSPEGPSIPRPAPVSPVAEMPATPSSVPSSASIPISPGKPPHPLPLREHVSAVYGTGIQRVAEEANTEIAVVNILVDMIRDMAWLTNGDVLGLRAVSQLVFAPGSDFVPSKFDLPRRTGSVDTKLPNYILRVVDETVFAILNRRSDVIGELLGGVNAAAVAADSSHVRPPAEAAELSRTVQELRSRLARKRQESKEAAAREARDAVGALCEGRLLAGMRDESSRITVQNPPSTFEIIDLLVDLFRLGGGLTGPHVATLHWICLRRFRDSPFPIPSVVANDTQALEDLRTEVRRWKRTVENRAFEEALRTECAARVQYGREIVQKVISDVTVVGLRDQELIDRLVAGIYSLAGEPVDPEIQRELEKLRGQARWAFGRDRATAPALPTGPPPTVNRYHPQATDESPSATRPTVPRPKGADLTPLGRAPQTDADYRRSQNNRQPTWSSSPSTYVPQALPPGQQSHRPEWTPAAGTGASPASGVEQNGRPGRISLRDPRVFVPVIILIFIVLVVLMIVTADREKSPVGISVVGVDGEFKKVVNSGGVWQAPDVPAVFAEAALHTASARPAPDKIMLTVSRKWQDRAVSALDGASVEGIGGVSSKPAGAIVIIDPKDGGVRAVATRGQAAGNNNLAVGLAVDPGELTAVLSAVAMDKDALSRLVNPSSGEEKCGKFPDMIRYLCPGTAAFLQQQLIQGSSLDRVQKIACGLGFDGMPHSVNGVQIAASSILLGKSCGATPAAAADAPIRVTPFQLAVVASALAAGSNGNPPPCPHLLVEAPANRCAIGIGDVRLAVEAAQEIRKATAEGNPGFALMTSSTSAGFVDGDKAGWAVGFAPANNPTVAIAVCVSAATTDPQSVRLAARDTAVAVLREVQ